MAAKLKAYAHLAIAHVLFIDMVGCSKLLVNEQREVVDELTCISQDGTVRKSEAAGELIRIPVGDGWGRCSSRRRKYRCNVRWKLRAVEESSANPCAHGCP